MIACVAFESAAAAAPAAPGRPPAGGVRRELALPGFLPSVGSLPPPPLEDDDASIDDMVPSTDDAGVPSGESERERYEARLHEFDLHMLHARQAIDRERFDEAEQAFTAALELLPGDPGALLGRAQARKRRAPEGQCTRSAANAVNDLRELARQDPRGLWLSQRETAIEWMGHCGSRFARTRLKLALEVAEEPPGSLGRSDDIRVTAAELLHAAANAEGRTPADRAELRKQALAHLEQHASESRLPGHVPSARGLRRAGDLYRELEVLDHAMDRYEELLRLHPKAPETQSVASIVEELKFARELARLDQTQGFEPSAAAQAAFERGTAALRAGDFGLAERELSWAIKDSQWFPQAYYARGMAFARLQKFPRAVDDLSRAIRMVPSDYHAHMALGLLYKQEFAGAEDGEAIKHLSAALNLRPDLHRLHLLLGELYTRTDRQTAREHYQRFLQVVPFDDEDARQARKRLEELEREIRKDEPTELPPPPEQSLRSLDPELQRLINEAYLRGTEHQDWARAESILLDARDRFPSEPVVLNELARVAFHQNRMGDARRHWDQSLAMLEGQVEVHERLGLMLRDALPDDAIRHLRRAAELGSTTARFNLAELLWQRALEPFEASRELDLYLREASVWDLYWERAQSLRREIRVRILQVELAAGIVLVLVVVVPGVRLWRRYRGASLEQLLARAPKSFPEVARILSLIRHEILKHNTAFLADVGRALELDAPDAEQRAEVLGQRLFGEGRGDERRAGIHGRFLGYLDDLERVGRAHKVTLNLQRKDPIFRPMIQAFDALARWAPKLRYATFLRPEHKLELARCLDRAGRVLGRQAFENLSALIRELCVTHVDPRLVTRVYEQVRGEKQFLGRELADLRVTGEGAPVRVFRTDLEDILANVFRNSLRSSVLYARAPIGLAVDLVTEIDEITGLGSIAIRIKDRSPEQLSNEMLRGRYVERGMGITVDLLSRYDGSIGVEPEHGWSKAVVLRFFTLEDEHVSAAEAEAAE